MYASAATASVLEVTLKSSGSELEREQPKTLEKPLVAPRCATSADPIPPLAPKTKAVQPEGNNFMPKDYTVRLISKSFILPMALVGFNPLGQTSTQFMIEWQRNKR